MALVIARSGDLSLEQIAPPAPVAPPITSTPAPRYLPPVSVPIMPAPTISAPPPGQHGGEGGTPFGAMPELYTAPAVLPPPPPDRLPRFWDGVRWVLIDDASYVPPPVLKYDPDAPAPETPTLQPRRGDDSVMPVLKGPVPTRPPAGQETPQITPPGSGPVRGSFLGADLSIIPMWAWLVGAALIGARLLK